MIRRRRGRIILYYCFFYYYDLLLLLLLLWLWLFWLLLLLLLLPLKSHCIYPCFKVIILLRHSSTPLPMADLLPLKDVLSFYFFLERTWCSTCKKKNHYYSQSLSLHMPNTWKDGALSPGWLFIIHACACGHSRIYASSHYMVILADKYMRVRMSKKCQNNLSCLHSFLNHLVFFFSLRLSPWGWWRSIITISSPHW